MDVGEEQDEAWINDQQSETGNSQRQILRMANALVEAAPHNTSTPELGVVKLKSTKEKADQTQQKDHSPETWENFGGKVRKKESWQPRNGFEAGRAGKQRAVDAEEAQSNGRNP